MGKVFLCRLAGKQYDPALLITQELTAVHSALDLTLFNIPVASYLSQQTGRFGKQAFRIIRRIKINLCGSKSEHIDFIVGISDIGISVNKRFIILFAQAVQFAPAFPTDCRYSRVFIIIVMIVMILIVLPAAAVENAFLDSEKQLEALLIPLGEPYQTVITNFVKNFRFLWRQSVLIAG